MMRKNDPLILTMAVFALIFIVSGCMSRQYVKRQTFALEVSRGEAASSESQAILRVRTFRVSPRYEGKQFVYREDTLSYESDFYNGFLTSPDTMITEEVRQWLADSGLFEQVVDFVGQVTPTHILEGEITDLYGDYTRDRGTQPKAAMAIRFFLINDIGGRMEIVFQKHYRREVPVKGETATALVDGWNNALEKILTDFEADLRKLDLSGTA
jgi:cholesterol transport system auxiliary component